MLVVVALIGVITAIVIPSVSKNNEATKEASARRNAQTVASVFAAAQVAGYDFSKKNGNGAYLNNVKEIIDAIYEGTTIQGSGPFAGTYFGISKQAEDTAKGLANFLEWDKDAGLLIYKAIGSQ